MKKYWDLLRLSLKRVWTSLLKPATVESGRLCGRCFRWCQCALCCQTRPKIWNEKAGWKEKMGVIIILLSVLLGWPCCGYFAFLGAHTGKNYWYWLVSVSYAISWILLLLGIAFAYFEIFSSFGALWKRDLRSWKEQYGK